MEKYLRQTLDSLVCDEMDSLDIIIVNDGSTDGSLTIAEEWASKYPKSVTIIDKENGGHGSAWNVGMAKACGNYLAFLDSDDWVYDISGYLQRLASADADLVFNDCIAFHEINNSSTVEKLNSFLPGIRVADNDILPLMENHCRIMNFHYCIYRTVMLQQYAPLFHEGTSYDDLILFTIPLFSAKTYEYSGCSFYVYRIGRKEQSMSSSVIKRKISQQAAERKYAIESAKRWMEENNSPAKNDSLNKILAFICSTYYSYIVKLERKRRNDELREWTNYIEKTFSNPASLFEYWAFRNLPVPLFLLSLKFYHLFRRVLI